jgi:hypothetical protein
MRTIKGQPAGTQLLRGFAWIAFACASLECSNYQQDQNVQDRFELDI